MISISKLSIQFDKDSWLIIRAVNVIYYKLIGSIGYNGEFSICVEDLSYLEKYNLGITNSV